MPETEPSSLREFAIQAIQPRLERMFSHLEGAKEGDRAEPIKQMRVWSRRTRAALEVFHDCFPDRAFRSFEREIKTITGALGAARDLDVMIDTLTKREQALPPHQRGGLASFIDLLKEQRDDAQKDVRETIDHLEGEDLMVRFHAMAAPPPKPEPDSKQRRRKGRRHGKG